MSIVENAWLYELLKEEVLSMLTFSSKKSKYCKNKPEIVDQGFWYKWGFTKTWVEVQARDIW